MFKYNNDIPREDITNLFNTLSVAEKVWYGEPKDREYPTNEVMMYVDDKPVAYCKSTIIDNVAALSYMVDKDYRRKGYGSKVVQEIINSIEDLDNVEILAAGVDKHNVSSRRFLIDNNFKQTAISESTGEYIYTISMNVFDD